jgi:DNA-binding NtrC family response regulator
VPKDFSSYTGKERVLVVDDEVDVADSLAIALQRLGYEAVPVYGPEEALAAVSAAPLAWDVVVTDQVMPQMRGLELARKLKRLNEGLDIILCTGFSATVTEQKALDAGASAFFFKPVASEVIAETIRRLKRGGTERL